MADPNVIYNPPIPHVSVIPGGIFPGRAIIVKGVVMTGGNKRFSINLCCGLLVEGDHTDDKAFHFDARFDDSGWFGSGGDNDIVLNALVNNTWGPEERHSNSLKPGQSFQIRILALANYYKIAVNGKHLCDFQHRLSLDSIRTLYIAGAVQVDFIEYQGEVDAMQQQSAPPATAPPQEAPVSTGVIHRPPIPFDLPVTGGFTNGRQFVLTGTPRMTAETFAINFCSGRDIVFHFNPRFNPKDHAIVRSSMKDGKWQVEERQASSFPFMTGACFDIAFVADKDFFKVAVNGSHLLIFKYRGNPALIDRINVDGDLTLQQAQLI